MMETIFLVVLFILFLTFFVVFIVKTVHYGYAFLFWGAIYVPTATVEVEKIVYLIGSCANKKAVDLGSGDGRLIIALARVGAEAHGYEINPFLVWLSRKNISKTGLEGRAFAHWGSFWGKNLSPFDIVVVYGMKHVMGRLEKKLDKELAPGSCVISNKFIFPKWKTDKTESRLYGYIKK